MGDVIAEGAPAVAESLGCGALREAFRDPVIVGQPGDDAVEERRVDGFDEADVVEDLVELIGDGEELAILHLGRGLRDRVVVA